MKRLLAITAFILALAQLPAHAQKVGVVLSGGGAKGLFHVGVLQALEEQSIPIDYISGTSMGAIVGGLYAIGYTPGEIGEILSSQQVLYWVTGQIEDKYSYYFKEMDRRRYLLTVSLDPGDPARRAKLPNHFVNSTQLDLAFIEFFSSATAACNGDFNELVVPFRCVSTDAMGKRAVTFSEGDLGHAIRSSMSIPFLFAPVRTDSMLLYDGGLADNFPWKALMDDFQPDLLIGSKCVGAPAQEDGGSLADQASIIINLNTDYRLPRETDIMIDSLFPNVSMMDFVGGRDLIKAGYDYTMHRMDTIKGRVQRRADPDGLASRRRAFRDAMPPLVFSNYNIRGLNPDQTAYVRRLLGMDDANPYTFEEFRSEYYKLLADGDITGGFPDVTYDGDKEIFTLEMDMKSRPSFRLLLGGNISSTALNQASLALEYKRIGRSSNRYNIYGRFSALHSSLGLGGRNDFFIGKPFYAEYGFSSNFFNYFRSNYGYLKKGSSLTYSKYRDHYLTLAMGMPASRASVVNVRLNAGFDEYLYYQDAAYDETDAMDRTRFYFAGAKIEYERNSLNYPSYPTKGIYQTASVVGIAGRERFRAGVSRLAGQSANRYWAGARFKREQYFKPPVKWFSFGYMVDAIVTNHPDMVNDYASHLSSPAFTPTPHSKIVYLKEFRSNSYLAAGVMPTLHFTPNLYLTGRGYFYLPVDDLSEIKNGVKQRPRYMADLSLVYQSIIGPASISLSQYDTKSNNWFVTLNIGFTMFNDKGLFY